MTHHDYPILAMAHYARCLEANEVACKSREGVPDAEIVAALEESRRKGNVATIMARLFSGPDADQHDI